MLCQKNFINKFFNYGLVGIVCTSIYFLTMFFFVETLDIKPVKGASLSFVIMTTFSFVLNKKYTFGSLYTHSKLIKFTIVALIGFILNFVIIYSTVNVLSFHYITGEIVTILILPLANFLINNHWTFSNS